MSLPRRLAFLALAAAFPCGVTAATITGDPAPMTPPASDARLDAIARAPSAGRIEADIRTLVGFGTRHTLSD